MTSVKSSSFLSFNCFMMDGLFIQYTFNNNILCYLFVSKKKNCIH